MGVPGLWPILQPAASVSTLAKLADEAFRSKPGTRGFIVGVDAAIWIFHSRKLLGIPDAGENPDLRTLFYRLAALMSRGILPLFVFDGPNKPRWKRGKEAKRAPWETKLIRNFKEMIDLMGGHWRVAQGEAEADLAAFAMAGEIDAVITDDVDTLVFGGTMIIRNASVTLTGNSSSQSQSSSAGASASSTKHDIAIYRSSDILSTLSLTREDLILVALLAGGDYHPSGIKGIGPTVTLGLIRCGFASSLLKGLRLHAHSDTALQQFMAEWREDVAVELATNSQKFLSRKERAMAGKMRLAEDFPRPDVVSSYTDPAVTTGKMDRLYWEDEVDVPTLVGFCSRLFEWSCPEIVARMRNTLWKGLAMRELRRTALAIDRSLPATISSSSSPRLPMFVSVHDAKLSDSTEGVLSYRVELSPTYFLASLLPHLPDPDPFPIPEDAPPIDQDDAEEDEDEGAMPRPSQPKPKRKLKEPTGRTALSHWFPAEFFRKGGKECEGLVEEWEEKGREKERKKNEGEERKKAKERGEVVPRVAKPKLKVAAKPSGKGKGKAKEVVSSSSSEDEAEVAVPVRTTLAKKGPKETALQKAKRVEDLKQYLSGGLSSDSDDEITTLSAIFRSSKPGLSSSKHQDLLPPSSTPLNFDPITIASSPPPPQAPAAPPAKKPLARRSPSTSSDTDENAPSTSHVTKSPRVSRAHGSPKKAQRTKVFAVRPPALVLEISDSEEERGGGVPIMTPGKPTQNVGSGDAREKEMGRKAPAPKFKEKACEEIVISDSE